MKVLTGNKRFPKSRTSVGHLTEFPITLFDIISESPTKSQHLDDECNHVILPTTPPTLAKTTWTLLIYLTGPSTGCIGGETVFYPEPPSRRKSRAKSNEGGEPIVIGLEVGMALLHKHGQECMLHEGREVHEGEKWIIRSDLCVKR